MWGQQYVVMYSSHFNQRNLHPTPHCFSLFLHLTFSISPSLWWCLFLLCLFMYLIRYRVIQYNANKGNRVYGEESCCLGIPRSRLVPAPLSILQTQPPRETQTSSVQSIPFDVQTQGSIYFCPPTVSINYPRHHSKARRGGNGLVDRLTNRVNCMVKYSF